MRLARSRAAAGATVPVVAHEQHWFDLNPLGETVGPETLSATSLAGIRAAIEAGRLPQIFRAA